MNPNKPISEMTDAEFAEFKKWQFGILPKFIILRTDNDFSKALKEFYNITQDIATEFKANQN